MKMTPTERRMFKEQVIRDYKLRHERYRQKKHPFNILIKRMRRLAPLTVILGVAASIILVRRESWDSFLTLLLSGIIWITLISAGISMLHKEK